MKYSCVLFDIDNTLLLRKPSIVVKIYTSLFFQMPTLTIETIEKIYAESELWIGNQVRKENETGIRMDDDEFCRNILAIYRNELHFDDDIEPELLSIVSGRYEKNYVLMPGAYETLEFLRKSNVKTGIVRAFLKRGKNSTTCTK